ncbi:hypothetical protein BJX99DRAFT_227844 [Aspergillus californicus]
MLSKQSTTFLSLSLGLFTPILAQSVGSNCTVFNWDDNPSYLKEDAPPIRVSGASTCPENSANLTCALTASGDAQVRGTSNITSLNIGTFVNVVESTVDNSSFPAPGFNETVVGSIDATRVLTPGQSAYLNFTTYLFCYTGSVGNCTEGVEDGAAVELCAPVWHEDGSATVFDGVWTVVNVSQSDVDQYSDPYENQIGGDDGEGAAVGLRLNGGLALLACAVAGVMVSF